MNKDEHSLHAITLELQRRLVEKEGNNVKPPTIDDSSEEERTVDVSSSTRGLQEDAGLGYLSNEKVLFQFMHMACEPITWIEAKELWNDMRSTNNGVMPKFRDSFIVCSHQSMRRLSTRQSTSSLSDDIKASSTVTEGGDTNTNNNKKKINVSDEELVKFGQISSPSDEQLSTYALDLATGIKERYSIRLSTDMSELKFIICALGLLWLVVFAVGLAGYFHPNNEKLGTFNASIFVESFILFGAELVWECILSFIGKSIVA